MLTKRATYWVVSLILLSGSLPSIAIADRTSEYRDLTRELSLENAGEDGRLLPSNLFIVWHKDRTEITFRITNTSENTIASPYQLVLKNFHSLTKVDLQGISGYTKRDDPFIEVSAPLPADSSTIVSFNLISQQETHWLKKLIRRFFSTLVLFKLQVQQSENQLPDADGDGVPDANDLCSDTPVEEPVDAQGCADSQKDSDGDGVPDNLDQCLNSAPGEPVDEQGCPINVEPDAVDDFVRTTEATAITIAPLTNDVDIEGDVLTIARINQPANGNASISSDNTSITYAPNMGFTGLDQVTYTISDGKGGEDTATINIAVFTDADDADEDGISDASDNCLNTPNIDQEDTNNNGIGNACELIGAITILIPNEGSVIGGRRTSVSGTFSAPGTGGVRVQQRHACIHGNSFYLNAVPVNPGPHTLIAQISPEGTGIGQSAEVNIESDGTNDFHIEVDSDCEIAPFDASFSVTLNSPDIRQIDVDFNGDGIIDASISNRQASLSYRYTEPGIYQASFTATSNTGNVNQQAFFIVAHDRDNIISEIRQTWANILAALTSSDVDLALNYAVPAAQANYRSVFKALQSDMGTIIGSFSELQIVSVHQDLVECAINRNIEGINRIFFIAFVKDNDGAWKIDSM